jgi:hypothetical protein
VGQNAAVAADRMGVSGIVVKGEVFEISGLRTLAVEGLVP